MLASSTKPLTRPGRPPLPAPPSSRQILHESWHVVWAVTGVVGFVILAFPEALNIVSLLRRRRASVGGAAQPRAGAVERESFSGSDGSGSKPVSSYTATAI